MGPETMSCSAPFEHSRRFFGAFDTPPRTVPVEPAQALARGAVACSASFGFKPRPAPRRTRHVILAGR
jgi:hypothetical protein